MPLSEQEILETVSLGLVETIQLPLKLSKAINGKDVFVVEEGKPPVKGQITMRGRDAKIQRGLRNQLQERWPNLFKELTAV